MHRPYSALDSIF